MKTAGLVFLALVLQAALGIPGAPVWLSAVLLPMVFVVGPPLLRAERRWPHHALLLGIAWDLLLEPVVGPGAIAWSATAVIIGALVPLVSDRSPRAWLVFGALGAALLVVIRHLAYLPLGLPPDLTARLVLPTVVLTAAWCGLVSWLIALDLPLRWRTYRARKLR